MSFPVPRAPKIRPFAPQLPVPALEEVSSGGLMINFDSPDLPVAIIARYNRNRQLEWCLPKGHVEGHESLIKSAAIATTLLSTGAHMKAPKASFALSTCPMTV